MIKILAQKDFDEVYNIMEASFPKDEYRTYEEQKALLDNAAYRIYVFTEADNSKIKVFMAVWEFDSFVFIEHFAVNPLDRNGGIGSRMLREVVASYEKMVCLEVELPETEMASRRIGFYERCGFVLNTYPYTQPAISKGRNPIPLLLMTSGREIEADEFTTMKKILYSRVYHCVTE